MTSQPVAITHSRCGWIGNEVSANSPGTQSFQNNSSFFDIIHPCFWFVSQDSTLKVMKSALDAALITQIANNSSTKLWPMIAGPQDNKCCVDIGNEP